MTSSYFRASFARRANNVVYNTIGAGYDHFSPGPQISSTQMARSPRC